MPTSFPWAGACCSAPLTWLRVGVGVSAAVGGGWNTLKGQKVWRLKPGQVLLMDDHPDVDYRDVRIRTSMAQINLESRQYFTDWTVRPYLYESVSYTHFHSRYSSVGDCEHDDCMDGRKLFSETMDAVVPFFGVGIGWFIDTHAPQEDHSLDAMSLNWEVYAAPFEAHANANASAAGDVRLMKRTSGGGKPSKRDISVNGFRFALQFYF